MPPIEYPLIYRERVIRSVTNSTRRDAAGLLRLAAAIPVTTEIQVFPLEQANDALIALKHDGIRGAAVLQVARTSPAHHALDGAGHRRPGRLAGPG